MENAVRKLFARLVRALPFSLQRHVLGVLGNPGLGLRLMNEELARLAERALAVQRPEPLPTVAKAVVTALRVIAPLNLATALRGETQVRALLAADPSLSDFEFLGRMARIADAMANADPGGRTTAPKIAVSLALRTERERVRLADMERQRQLVASNLLSLVELIHQDDVRAARDLLRKVAPGLADAQMGAGALAASILKALPDNLAQDPAASPLLSHRAFFIATVAVTTSHDFASTEKFAQHLLASGPSAFDPIRTSYVMVLEELLRTCGNPAGVDHPSPLRIAENSTRMQTDAERLLAPWRQSLGYRLVIDRETQTRAKAATAPRHLSAGKRVLVITNGNWFFLHEVIDALENMHGVQCRTFDFALAQESYELSPREAALPRSAETSAARTHGDSFDASLFKQLLAWADVIFVEWCEWAAVWLSDYLPSSKRLVVRLHSYEAFAPTPHFVNWANVDALVFVADHIMKFFNVQFSERLTHTTQTVIDNIRDLGAFQCDGEAHRDCVLGMLGYNNANKNPRMALEILRALRADDPRWKLRLLGPAWPEDAELGAHELEYKTAFFADLAAFDLTDAVQFVGEVPSHAVNRAMLDCGLILSCSEREGTHEAVVEGIASGCVPLIRNWPTSAAYDGARTVYAPFREFVFDSVEQAVATARAHGAPDAAARRAIAARGVAAFDQGATLPGLLDVLFPAPAARLEASRL